jgi:putative nucleotidyltransferase with HDIG domain
MKDPVITNEQFFKDISELAQGDTGQVDTFKWEIAYRELGQSQAGQQQREKLPGEGRDRYRDESSRLLESSAGPIANTTGPMEGFFSADPIVAERRRMEATRQAAHDELERRVTDRTAELMRVTDALRAEITERRRIETELRAAQEELERRMADRTGELARVNEELRTEIGERKGMEAVLQAAHDELEQRVADRTDELIRVNEELRTKVAEHQRLEAALQAAHNELEGRVADRTDELTRVNDGLRAEIAQRKNAEEELRHTLDNLQKTLGAAIQVMGAAVEMKDPYTAGHQTRSTTLARNIARMMGLSREQINTIRMAGLIHDIGKLSIPAEILSKPGKLSDSELPLVKEHARRGYEILKDVEFPWPLAEIVHQHHERMDGSGYPRNLKGDEICVEARIMAVADVVEAMVSHRPYRRALGIEAALEEIEGNRGILYDHTVADACLQLFREKGFQLAEA